MPHVPRVLGTLKRAAEWLAQHAPPDAPPAAESPSSARERVDPGPVAAADAPPRVAPGDATRDAPSAPPPFPARYWPVTACLGAVGVSLVALAGGLSREGRDGAEPLFFLGLLTIVLPVLIVVMAARVPRAERLAAVVTMSMTLYMVKVVHSPVAFTFSDEFMHQSNARGIIELAGLFPQNQILEVSVYYPGLASVTAALSLASGLSTFVSGLIVIGAVRVLFMLALFLLLERLTGSHRAAGMACCAYVAAPNYLFWGASFSYQSMAFPLAVFVLTVVVWSHQEPFRARGSALRAAALIAILAIITTHHLTGYALIGFFIAISLAALVGLGRRRDSAWWLAAFTAGAAVAWLIQIAPVTQHYLTFIFERAFDGVASSAQGSGSTRKLFSSDSGYVAPTWERVVSLGSVVLIAVLLPWGALRVWRRRHRHALQTALALAGIAFIATLPLRLVPTAWETANRASDYFYLGVALLLAVGGLHLSRSGRVTPPRAVAACAVLAVMVVGGVITGWPPAVRLPQPRIAELGGRTIEPQGFALASWSRGASLQDDLWVADEADGRLLLDDGRRNVIAGRGGLAQTFLNAEALTGPLLQLAADEGLRYIAIDRRPDARDGMYGNYFPPAGLPPWGRARYRPATETSVFDHPPMQRLFDSGDIAAYAFP